YRSVLFEQTGSTGSGNPGRYKYNKYCPVSAFAGNAMTQAAPSQADQNALNEKLEQANRQLLQSEKLAAIGQLAAGVAHEINNPVGYVYSNLQSLESYLNDLFRLTDAVDSAKSLDDL